MTNPRSDEPSESPNVRRVALRILASFVLTFIASRVVVYLIMNRAIPDLYLYVGGTHVHHLNYGIFLLSGVGAYLLLRPPAGRARFVATLAYGIGLALTFDEFGMWLHLGGDYWQRASYDAVVVIAALLACIALVPSMRHFGKREWITLAVLVVAVIAFGFVITHRLTRT
ncbi:MAG: hypothetical protein JNG88_06665 [Phycisphaerales bacterium]|nr:hypothetical protein [Phycisphaerales bacterium]